MTDDKFVGYALLGIVGIGVILFLVLLTAFQ
jgi:hypothetical protein